MKAVSNYIKLVVLIISTLIVSNLANAVEFRGSATERFEGFYTKKKLRKQWI